MIKVLEDFLKYFRKKRLPNNVVSKKINVTNNKGQVNIANGKAVINATQNIIEQKEFNPNKKIIYTNLQMLSPTFVGREEYVKQIDCLLNKDVIVLSANGGIGKTQIVLKYIKSFKEKYEHIAFINASTYIVLEEIT